MYEEMIDLARRAVACPKWRWMPGMLATRPELSPAGLRVTMSNLPMQSMWLPDFTDPATWGCLLALVREAWNNKVVITIGKGWFQVVTDVRDWDVGNTSSLLLALIAALEAAPPSDQEREK
jgi:hypothetical protein